jgi:hypothetical protein
VDQGRIDDDVSPEIGVDVHVVAFAHLIEFSDERLKQVEWLCW